jgi:hypothetical protein
MFVVLLVAYVPLAIIGVSISLAIIGNDMPPPPDFASLASGKLKPEDAEKLVEAWQTGLLAAMRMHWTEFAILNYIGAIIGAALVAGIAGNAYLELAGEPHQEDVTA